MRWEYKIIEFWDDDKPPGQAGRYDRFLATLNLLAKEGWEMDKLIPSYMKGTAGAGGVTDGVLTLTVKSYCALLRRKVE
jgi:hypothetical protein